MKKTFEVGDRVKVKSTAELGGIAYTNDAGGTSEFPVGTTKECKIIRAWGDYEIGRRYVGMTSDGQEIYFGHFGIEIEPIEADMDRKDYQLVIAMMWEVLDSLLEDDKLDGNNKKEAQAAIANAFKLSGREFKVLGKHELDGFKIPDEAWKEKLEQ